MGGGSRKEIVSPILASSDDKSAVFAPSDSAITGDSGGRSIPNVKGFDLYRAALAYAENNLYILPVDSNRSKNPGSVVGKGWPHKSTVDPDLIDFYWGEDSPNVDAPPSIAIHTGRSQLVAFDLDTDVLPDELTWLRSGLYQASRSGASERGHYVFASAQTFVSGKLCLADGAQVGEIRSGNSVILVQPSQHAKADEGGHYRWVTTGQIPSLPEVARFYLRPLTAKAVGGDFASQSVTDERVTEFIAATADAEDRPSALTALVGMVAQRRSGTRDCVRDVLRIAAGESRLGYYPFGRAVSRIEQAARESYAKRGESFNAHIGPTEFGRLVVNGVGWALARDLDDLKREANREYGTDTRDYAGMADGLRLRAEGDRSLTSDMADFWSSSPQVRDLRQFAQSRRVGPAAMLGNSLARVVAAIPPNVVLPPTIGSVAGLNLFVALVGRSGESKSASMGASADWLAVDPGYSPAKPASGEGLAKCFASVRKVPGSNGGPASPVQVGKAWSVLAQLPEVDTLTATGGRGGATIMSELRSAWSGERLGFDYSGDEKRITLCANRYRLCLVLGVQPLRAGPLFDDADGGTPQRFVWFPANDTDAPSVRPVEPHRLVLPRWPELRGNGLTDPDVALRSALAIAADPVDYRVLEIPEAARSAIDENQLAVLRGDPGVDPLDGHRLLVRLKLAAALMALESRYEAISEADWQRAGVLMVLSDATRQSVRNELTAKAAQVNVSRGRAEGERAEVAEQTKVDRAVARVAENIAKKLAANGPMARSDLRKIFASRDRPYFDDAEASLIGTGKITKSVADSAGGSDGYVLALVETASK